MRIRRITSVVGATARVNTGSHHMPGGADDHLMAPRRVRKPGVDQRETGDVFHPHTADRSDQRPEASRGSGKRRGSGAAPARRPGSRTDQRNGADQGIGPFIAHYAAIIPTGRPISRAKPKARMHSSMVAGNTSRNCSEISWPLMLETPKSQCSTPSNQNSHAFHGKRPAVGHEGEIAQAETDKGQKKEGDQQRSRRRRVKIIMASSPLRYFPAIRPANEALPKGLSTRPFIS